jgi:hypothetical protein
VGGGTGGGDGRGAGKNEKKEMSNKFYFMIFFTYLKPPMRARKECLV